MQLIAQDSYSSLSILLKLFSTLYRNEFSGLMDAILDRRLFGPWIALLYAESDQNTTLLAENVRAWTPAFVDAVNERAELYYLLNGEEAALDQLAGGST
jgi:TorA maturation chaperone TorD